MPLGALAGVLDDVMWLRAEDKEIDAAKLVRVTVSECTTGRGRKRKTSFVCTGTLHKNHCKSSHNNCVMMLSCKPEVVKKVAR